MIKVPGSIFRQILFWAHLSCGVSLGALILLMSFTGVMLAYEPQIVDAKAEANRIVLPSTATRLTADQLIEKARGAVPAGTQFNLVFDADASRPVVVSYGRQQVLLNPQTGEVMPDAAAGARSFFRSVENLHRWLGSSPQSTGTTFMHLANLLFVFLILSGIYIWLPPAWKWPVLRARMFFKSAYMTSKARDFNWHHVFSFWMFIPLFLIAFSGVVMSYPWANSMLFAAYGEKAPQRQGPPGGPGAAMTGSTRSGGGGEMSGDATVQHATAQQLLDTARSKFVNWQRISLPANARGESIDISAELKSDGPRVQRQTLTLSTRDASVIRMPPPPMQTPGQRARAWIRFVHTGEQYGVIGQTIAAIASLAACFLFYTGIALAWRRLIVPLYKKE